MHNTWHTNKDGAFCAEGLRETLGDILVSLIGFSLLTGSLDLDGVERKGVEGCC